VFVNAMLNVVVVPAGTDVGVTLAVKLAAKADAAVAASPAQLSSAPTVRVRATRATPALPYRIAIPSS
jgi:hypothetical protein